MVFPKPHHCTAVVSSKTKLTEKVYLVTFAMKDPPELDFVAGQTMVLHIAEGINRSMSIASVPSDPKNIVMCHDVSPMGPGSKWTLGLSVGDSVSFMAPLGAFVLDKESPRKKVFVATGTGVVPFRSMLLDVYSSTNNELNPNIRIPSQLSNSHIRTDSLFVDTIVLYWGLRYEEDIYWKDEFEKIEKEHPNFRFVFTLSKPTQNWLGKKGRVTDHVFSEEKNLPACDVYLCGNKEMVREVKDKLLALNVPKEQIKQELFF